ncbi:MAG: DUF4402 domain-containing protein [Bacteroidota bacterium]
MKNITKVIALAIVALGISSTSFAQSTATASTTATLVVPISIANNTNMNFGIVASSATLGTVDLNFADGRTAGGGASLPAGGGTNAKTAVFTVTGEGNSTFSISIPAAPITLTGSVAGTMTVSDFVADLGASGTLSSGTKVIKVKAKLNVPANSVSGVYSNASDLFVTVNYN